MKQLKAEKDIRSLKIFQNSEFHKLSASLDIWKFKYIGYVARSTEVGSIGEMKGRKHLETSM